jgi:hypothetical protein
MMAKILNLGRQGRRRSRGSLGYGTRRAARTSFTTAGRSKRRGGCCFTAHERGTPMHQTIEPTEISFDAYTLCSFLPQLDSARAIPLVLIGYRRNQDPWFVWLVPKEGISAVGLTDDPYYAKVLHDPHTYFTKKLSKYIEVTGSVKRGIEMLIDCHQNHLAFTPVTHLSELPFRHPLEVRLVGAY